MISNGKFPGFPTKEMEAASGRPFNDSCRNMSLESTAVRWRPKSKPSRSFLNKFDYQALDAIRDVESELFSGSNSMLRTMLQQVLDVDTSDDSIRLQRESDFIGLSQDLSQSLIARLHLPILTELVDKTGADDGGTSHSEW